LKTSHVLDLILIKAPYLFSERYVFPPNAEEERLNVQEDRCRY
jgi:hypothetical protein